MDMVCHFETTDNGMELDTDKKRGVHPSLASVCNLVFHCYFFKPDSIAVLNDQQQRNHSYAALLWLHNGFAPETMTIFAYQG